GRPGPINFYDNQPRYSRPLMDVPYSTVPPGMSYFDNAGFFNTGTEDRWPGGGCLIQVRTLIYLPEF
ncbi:MAG: hypothetical protein V2A56_06475, partial [bacterium]